MSVLAIRVQNAIRCVGLRSGLDGVAGSSPHNFRIVHAQNRRLTQIKPISHFDALLSTSTTPKHIPIRSGQMNSRRLTLQRLLGSRNYTTGVGENETGSTGPQSRRTDRINPGTQERAIGHGIQGTDGPLQRGMGHTTVHSSPTQSPSQVDGPNRQGPNGEPIDTVFFDEETLTQFQVPFYQISMETGVAVVTERKVSKYELSYETGMPLRDLRPFTHQLNRRVQVAGLVTRPRSFLVNFEPLQAIVMPDRLQIFNVEPEDQPYMTALMRKLQRPSQAAFEHRSLECVLSITVKKLEQEASSFDDRLTAVLNNATRNPSSQNLWDLREISDTIEAHGAYVRQALSAITGVLQKDELMNMMYLARNQTGKIVNDHRDVELILEAAEDRLQALDHSCVMSQSRITNAEQYLAVSNDTQRNEIIRVTLYATVISLGFSAVAVVGSIFGMNLSSGWETDPEMFVGVVVAMGFLFLGVLAEGAFMIRRIDADRPRSKAGRTFKF